jgi:hypothetical protein
MSVSRCKTLEFRGGPFGDRQNAGARTYFVEHGTGRRRLRPMPEGSAGDSTPPGLRPWGLRTRRKELEQVRNPVGDGGFGRSPPGDQPEGPHGDGALDLLFLRARG